MLLDGCNATFMNLRAMNKVLDTWSGIDVGACVECLGGIFASILVMMRMWEDEVRS